MKDGNYSNMEEFKDFIEDRYTSCSGFISYYSSNHLDWLDEFANLFEDEHKLGALLEFVCEIEEITEESIFDYVETPILTINEE